VPWRGLHRSPRTCPGDHDQVPVPGHPVLPGHRCSPFRRGPAITRAPDLLQSPRRPARRRRDGRPSRPRPPRRRRRPPPPRHCRDGPALCPGRDLTYRLTPNGRRELATFGLDLAAVGRQRPAIRYCLAWSEQRHHRADHPAARPGLDPAHRAAPRRHPHRTQAARPARHLGRWMTLEYLAERVDWGSWDQG